MTKDPLVHAVTQAAVGATLLVLVMGSSWGSCWCRINRCCLIRGWHPPRSARTGWPSGKEVFGGIARGRTPEPGDLLPLSERLGYIEALRVALAAIVLTSAAL